MARSRLNPNYIAVAHDGVMAAVSLVLALYLRLGDNFRYFTQEYLPYAMGGFTLVAMGVFITMRLYRGLWRYASLQDLATLMKAATLAIFIFYPAFFLFNGLDGMPRSVPFIQWMLLIVMLGGPRFIYRFLKDGRHAPEMILGYPDRIPVLLVGVNDNTELFLRDAGPRSHYRAVAVIDDDKAKVGRSIRGVKIYGTMEGLPRLIEKLTDRGKRPQKMLLTDDHIDAERVKYILRISEDSGIPLARLPRLTDFRDGVQESSLELRAIAIEDLLGRPQHVHDRDAMHALVQGKTVLVTGAGGTIGGELSRQIAQFAPKQLLLLDASEYHLYQIDREIALSHADLNREAVIGDVRDAAHLDALFARTKPEIIFHAAALKHVPIAETNPEEAMLINTVGTRCVAEICQKHGVQAMVMISTDKAVNPANIMGATKRLSEKLMQAMAAGSARTRFITVRFGNVLGSTGSVVPLFREQLARGGPVTVTHADMTRYFMTVREAVELVLQAAALGVKESAGAPIFVLDMGEPVRIKDLAMQMIRLAGLRPHKDIAITYTGLRPGEKMHEELFYTEEAPGKTAHAGILRASPPMENSELLLGMLSQMEKTCRARKASEAIALLKTLVPEYKPFEQNQKQTGS